MYNTVSIPLYSIPLSVLLHAQSKTGSRLVFYVKGRRKYYITIFPMQSCLPFPLRRTMVKILNIY